MKKEISQMQRERGGKRETGYGEKGIRKFIFLDSIISKNQKQTGLEYSAVVKTDAFSLLK